MLAFLSPVPNLTDPRQFRLHCARCPACCKTVRVPLTHHDLSRLVQATSVTIDTLVDWLAPDEIDMSGEPDSFVELNVGRRLLVLGHVGEGCRFLSSVGRCTIYESRPSPCAAYPFSIERRKGPARLELLSDAPCDRDSAEARLVADGGRDAALLAVERVEEELADYVQRVSQWNRQQRRRRLLRRPPLRALAFFEFLVA